MIKKETAPKTSTKKTVTHSETKTPSIDIKLATTSKTPADVLVVLSQTRKKGSDTSVVITHSDAAKKFANSVSDKTIAGKHKETVLFRETNFNGYKHVLIAGLGDADNTEKFRQTAAAVLKALQSLKIKSADISMDGVVYKHSLQGMVEGLMLASYKFDELKTKAKAKEEDSCLAIQLVSKKFGDKDSQKTLLEAQTLIETVNFSRRLGDMPGNLMTPTILADSTVEAARGTGLKVTVWDKARIEKENMGGLLGVSRGSDQEPRFIIMEYSGAGAKTQPLVYVGKGLTFDTGGISIKPSGGMEEMKYDMCGGANVIGAVLAIAKLKLKVNVVGLVASTENMPGPSATKPGDVHTARNGKTFEINNTDAEGRLILADALSYGTELKPLLMVDAATLTGAMVVALGNIHTGFFTRNEALRKKVLTAAENSGEWVWPMPLTDCHNDDMKGTFADLSNMSCTKGAGSATAAAFLENFVGSEIPWAHFDIAGTGWAVGNRLNYCSGKGASGVMIRTFVELAKLHSK
jgi:leucyl aminopeptidase